MEARTAGKDGELLNASMGRVDAQHIVGEIDALTHGKPESEYPLVSALREVLYMVATEGFPSAKA